MNMVEKNDEYNGNSIKWDALKILRIFQDKKDFLTTFHNELTLLPSDLSSEDPQRITDAFTFLELLEENYFTLGVLIYYAVTTICLLKLVSLIKISLF